MENPKNLHLECASPELNPKEDEVFTFLQQLHPLDFTYAKSSGSIYDVDATYIMDNISNTLIRSSMDTLPDPTVLCGGGFLVGKDGQMGFLDQEFGKMNPLSFPNEELSMMNALSFPNQEMNILGIQNQETYMNTLGYSCQTQPGKMAIENVKEKEETKMVRSSWCDQPQQMLDHKDGNCNGDGGCKINHPLRLTISREMISQYFYMPIADATKELNIGTTLLKKWCRELGIKRWPHRKLKSLQTVINNVQELRNSSGIGVEEKMQEAIIRLEKERKKFEEIPDLQLDVNTRWLRQVCFKTKYKKRKPIGT